MTTKPRTAIDSSPSMTTLCASLRWILSVACGLSISGCVPWVSHYERIDLISPGAVRFKAGCAGPPSLIFYPYHDIFISADFHSSRFGLHLPDGTTTQLNDDTIRIAGTSKSGQFDKHVQIKAVKQISVGDSDPPGFRALPDPYTSPDDRGPFVGRSGAGAYVYHLFLGIDENNPGHVALLPSNLLEGTMELPSMTINGHRYERQVLTFKRAHFFEFTPVNC